MSPAAKPQYIYMIPPGGGDPQRIELDLTDDFQLARLMWSGWTQADMPAEKE